MPAMLHRYMLVTDTFLSGERALYHRMFVIAAVVFAVIASGARTTAAAGPSKATIAPTFRPLLPALHRTGVPVLLPAQAAMLPKASAHLDVAGRGHYSITLGYVPNCDGHACEWGSLDAEPAPSGRGRPAGSPVSLPRGKTGYYLNFTCGANCGDSTVTLDFHGTRYTFGVKAGKRSEVVKLARSALQIGPV